jgi:hypothetical protein
MKPLQSLFYLWLLFFCSNVLWAQLALLPKRLNNFGGILGDTGSQIALDSQNNQWVTGFFAGTARFGLNSLQSLQNGLDAFIAKYDVQGNCLWAKRLGGNEFDLGKAIACLPSGNCCFSGTFRGKAWIGSDTLISRGDQDIFIALLAPDGRLLWVKSYGSNLREDVLSMASDGEGNIIVSGVFRSQLIFDDIELRGSAPNTNDVFLAKFNSQGAVLWARSFGNQGVEAGLGLCIDPSGFIYLGGNFNQRLELPEINTTLGNRSGDDVFIARYSPQGRLLWAKSAGSRGADAIQALAYHPNGFIAATGFYVDTLFFENRRLISKGGRDFFVTAFDTAEGKVQWSATGGSPTGNDAGWGITAAPNGNLYITGQIEGPLTWGKFSIAPKAQPNLPDIFIAAVDPFWGQPLGVVAYGGERNDRGNAIIASKTTNDLWVTGYFNDSLTIAPFRAVSEGSSDGFLVRFEIPRLQVYLPQDTLRVTCGVPVSIEGASVKPGLSWLWRPETGITNPRTAQTQGIFSSSGAYTLIGFDRGDSARADLWVEVSPIPPPSPLSATGKFSFCQGDSLLLKIEGDYAKIVWNKEYAQKEFYARHSGWHSFRVENAAGCQAEDSIWITAHPAPPVPEIQRDDNTLIGPQGYARYTWLEVGSTVVLGENRTFAPSRNGTYLLRITDSNGCENTSPPYSFVITALPPEPKLSRFFIETYPNPFKGKIQFRLKQLTPIAQDNANIQVDIYSLSGKKLDSFTLQETSNEEWQGEWVAPAPGTYALRVANNRWNYVTKITALE